MQLFAFVLESCTVTKVEYLTNSIKICEEISHKHTMTEPLSLSHAGHKVIAVICTGNGRLFYYILRNASGLT